MKIISSDEAFIAKELGKLFRKHRREQGLTLQYVAAHLETHKPVVARIEAGKHVPGLVTTLSYMALLGLRVGDLGNILDRSVRRTDGPHVLHG